MKGGQPMRSTKALLTLLAATAIGLVACKKSPSQLETSGGSEGGGDPEVHVTIDRGGATFNPNAGGALGARKLDYNEALRTASLKLVRALPTLTQIKNVANATDKKAAYETELDGMLADPRFQERMIKWWQDTMRLGGGAQNGMPSRDTAATFAARVVAEEQPFSEIFTAPSNTCPTYDSQKQAFVDGDCKNGVPAVSGVLTDPGVMYQFFGNMAFRRVRWVQEIFVCTKFPAEYAKTPVHMGSADYTSPWPFASVATMPINFQDTSSVICANCHTTINHIAPLFANFDSSGMYQKSIQVVTPIAPKAVPTEMSHWLAAGETTHWRNGESASDLVELGKAVSGDPDVAECAVARAWNFVMSKEDIVADLATVPPTILAAYLTEFQGNGENLKKTLRSMFASDDFVRF
jgi:hypothetical protein